MLVDVVNYGGELELLLARLHHMQADETVVVESDHQFQGQFKGYTFEEQDVWSLVEQYRVTYLPVAFAGNSNAWENEHHQRRAAKAVLEQMDLPGDSIVGVFDVDEFPDVGLLRNTQQLSSWRMLKYQMSLYWPQQDEVTGFSGTWAELSKMDFQNLRGNRHSLNHLIGGNHFSSFGSLKDVLTKWTGFSHTELRRADMDLWVEHCWTHGKAIENGSPLVEVENLASDLPEYMLAGYGPDHWYRRRPIS